MHCDLALRPTGHRVLSMGADDGSGCSSDYSEEVGPCDDIAAAPSLDNGPSRGYYGARGKGNGMRLSNPRDNLAWAFPSASALGGL